jgi:hypothetical protein
MGLRESARLVLTPQEIQHCWCEGAGSQGWEKIRTYLIYDLEDTKLIADKLVPSYYYESLIVPGMNLQQLTKVIRSGDFPVEQLQVTRKIKKGEKALLVLGNTGDVVTFYQGILGLTNSEVYSNGYYLELIAKKRDELLSVVEPQGNVGKQLSLF